MGGPQRRWEDAQERQPLVAAEVGDGVAPASQRGAAVPAPSAGTGSASGAAGGAAAPPAAGSRQASAEPAPACRICLQEDGDEVLESGICSCSGSMQWAHRGCIQRWIDEKHDRVCEVCAQPFQGAFRDPPPRPSHPTSPLIASLHVDNSDQRTVLLADPVTGEVVARVVMPAGGGDLSDDEMLQQWRRELGRSGGEVADEERGISEPAGSWAIMAFVLLIMLLMGGYGLMSSAAAAAEGQGEEEAFAGAWLVRIMLLLAWVLLRTVRPATFRRHLEPTEVVLYDSDLEAGGGQQQQQQQQQQPRALQQG